MLDIILIILMVKIGSNYKAAGETGASRHIVPTIACMAAAILLVLIGRSDENLTVMALALLCYVPALIFAIRGFKKSKALFAAQAAAGAGAPPAPAGSYSDTFTTVPAELLFQDTPVASFSAPLPAAEFSASAPETILEPATSPAQEPASVFEEEPPVVQPAEAVPEPVKPDRAAQTVFEGAPAEPAPVVVPAEAAPEPVKPDQTAQTAFEGASAEPAPVAIPAESAQEPPKSNPAAHTAFEEAPARPALPTHGFCNRCGAPLKGDAKFCHVCGAPVKRGVRPDA